MTHTCCPACRLRLTTATASGLTACPTCAGPLTAASATHVFGFPLWQGAPDASAPAAVAAALPEPPSGRPDA